MSEQAQQEQQSKTCQTLGHRWRHWAGDRWLIGWAVCHFCGEHKYFPPTKNPELASNFWHERRA